MSENALVVIPASDLLTVMPYRADEGDVRYYLAGIVIEPVESGGCMLVASDGHTMGVIFSKEARCDKARILNVSREFHRAMRDDGFTDDLRVKVKDGNSRATLHGCDGTERFVMPGDPFIDGKIIEWRKVIPPLEHLKPGSPAQLAARYLARLGRSVLEQRRNGVTFWQDERDPKTRVVVVRYEYIPELVVLIMPLRQDVETTWPAWYPKGEKPAEKPAEAAA